MQMKHKHTTKVIGTIIVLTLLIIGISIYAQKHLKNDSLLLKKEIEKIEESCKTEKWEQAAANLENTGSTWSNIKGRWSSLVDHQEIDNIDITLSRLKMLVYAKDTASALSEAAALKKYVAHIPAKEKLSIDNIF